MDRKYRVGVIGATGMVGQRLVSLLCDHPFFELTALFASARSAGKPYCEAVGSRWAMCTPIPENKSDCVVCDASDIDALKSKVDFVFCAVDMPKEQTRALEETIAKAEIPVISNNSACRWVDDVPMIIPEINPEHLAVIAAQKKRLGTKRGFIAVKSNCSIQSYVPALHPLRKYGIRDVVACTYQAISGAGKTFMSWPEMVDNVIPFIAGEEEKSEREPLKVWGSVRDGRIVDAASPRITSQCIRVPVSDGHMAAVFVKFDDKPSRGEILKAWDEFEAEPQRLKLPLAPEKFITYFEDPARPQTRLDRDLYRGMGVTVGRLREDCIYDYKFVSLSHNTLRGAAGGGVLTAELLAAKGYFD